MSEITYIQDGDDVVKQSLNETTIDFTELIQKYLSLKDRYLLLPKLKTVPDQETLDSYNLTTEIQRFSELEQIGAEASVLYTSLTAIKDAGLLPVQYEDEYQLLKIFVEEL